MAEMHAGIADDTPACRTSFVIDEGGLDELARRGRQRRRRGPGRAHRRAHDRSARHDRLHLGHDRTAQGLCDHARQPANERDAEPRRGALDARARRGQPRVPAARAHADQDHRPRRRRVGHQAGVRHRRRASPGGAGAGTADDGRRGAAGVREGLQRRAAQGPCRRARPASSTSRSRSPSAGPRTTPAGHPPDHQPRARRARAAWCTASCRPCSAGACASPSAAAAPSASGSRTSSTASGSRSSRATA